jgi:hypothetical protein
MATSDEATPTIVNGLPLSRTVDPMTSARAPNWRRHALAQHDDRRVGLDVGTTISVRARRDAEDAEEAAGRRRRRSTGSPLPVMLTVDGERRPPENAPL